MLHFVMIRLYELYFITGGLRMTETKIQEALKWLARQNTAIQLEAWKEAGYQDAYSERKKTSGSNYGYQRENGSG